MTSPFTTNPFNSGIAIRDITKKCTFSWLPAPTAITAGTFPDSFLDKNPETKLEFYGTHSGAGSQAQIKILLPKICFFAVLGDIGVGAQIGTDSSAGRQTYLDQGITDDRQISGWQTWKRTQQDISFSTRLLRYHSGLSLEYGNEARLIFYSDTAGDWAFEIFNIRILEFVGLSI